jgi:hypothetical protein
MEDLLRLLRGWGYVLLAGSFVYAVVWVLVSIVALLRMSRLDPIVTFIVVGMTGFAAFLVYQGLTR